MSEGTSGPDVGSVEQTVAVLRDMLAADPGVGFSIVDLTGVIRFTNARAADLFLGLPPERVIGLKLDELFAHEWALERMTVFERVRRTGTPLILRHIRRGKQLQSTIRTLWHDEGDDTPPAFIVVTVQGEHDPALASKFDVLESEIVDLGPLSVLTARELEVLALVGHGMSTNQIAATLFRSPRTVERHLDSVRQKLHAVNRLQLVDFARAAGLEVRDAGLRRTAASDDTGPTG